MRTIMFCVRPKCGKALPHCHFKSIRRLLIDIGAVPPQIQDPRYAMRVALGLLCAPVSTGHIMSEP